MSTNEELQNMLSQIEGVLNQLTQLVSDVKNFLEQREANKDAEVDDSGEVA